MAHGACHRAPYAYPPPHRAPYQKPPGRWARLGGAAIGGRRTLPLQHLAQLQRAAPVRLLQHTRRGALAAVCMRWEASGAAATLTGAGSALGAHPLPRRKHAAVRSAAQH